VVAKQLTTHLERNNLSARFQSGFRSHHSAETAVVKIANDVLSSIDSGNVTALVRLDLSAVFDTVDHEISLNRLATDFCESHASPYLGLGLTSQAGSGCLLRKSSVIL